MRISICMCVASMQQLVAFIFRLVNLYYAPLTQGSTADLVLIVGGFTRRKQYEIKYKQEYIIETSDCTCIYFYRCSYSGVSLQK